MWPHESPRLNPDHLCHVTDSTGIFRHANFTAPNPLERYWTGDGQPKPDDDYPDFVVPLAHAVARGRVDRSVANGGLEPRLSTEFLTLLTEILFHILCGSTPA
jgi:hypothetical protein